MPTLFSAGLRKNGYTITEITAIRIKTTTTQIALSPDSLLNFSNSIYSKDYNSFFTSQTLREETKINFDYQKEGLIFKTIQYRL